MKNFVDKIPIQGMTNNPELQEKKLDGFRIIISSMTNKERLTPDIINLSRITRIAKGCGRSAKEVNELLNYFKKIRTFFRKLGKHQGILDKVPGVSQFKQLREMQQMSNPEQLQEMINPSTPKKQKLTPIVDRNKIKKLRRATKNARRKNRR